MLPKGAGAVNGNGETFEPDLFSGTGNFSLPVFTSAGRAGFGPQYGYVHAADLLISKSMRPRWMSYRVNLLKFCMLCQLFRKQDGGPSIDISFDSYVFVCIPNEYVIGGCAMKATTIRLVTNDNM